MGKFTLARRTKSFSALGDTEEVRPVFVKAINDLVGFQNGIKRCHWSAGNHALHIQLDTVWDKTADYIDQLVEVSMGLFGRLYGINEILPTWITFENTQDMINKFCEKMVDFHEAIPDNVYFSGIISDLEDFISFLQQQRYMLSIAEDNMAPNVPNSGEM